MENILILWGCMMFRNDFVKFIFGISLFYFIYKLITARSVITTTSLTTGNKTETEVKDSLVDKINKRFNSQGDEK